MAGAHYVRRFPQVKLDIQPLRRGAAFIPGHYLPPACSQAISGSSAQTRLVVRAFARTLPLDIAVEAADLVNSELGDDEFSDTHDELAGELAGLAGDPA